MSTNSPIVNISLKPRAFLFAAKDPNSPPIALAALHEKNGVYVPEWPFCYPDSFSYSPIEVSHFLLK